MAFTGEKDKRNGARVLYITYDGLSDPLGGSQILPYLTRLTALGHSISILSCEKPERIARDESRIREQCNEAGIVWHALEYHKKPLILSSMLDAVALQKEAIRLHRRERFDMVHCRSYIPARAGLALKRRGARFLFDMRGFWPDEKVEGNNWNLANPLYAAVYRYFKRLESRLLSEADHIVSLTEAGKAQLLTRPELSGHDAAITVIPCCVDFDSFPLATADARQLARKRLAIDVDVQLLAYLGSLGSWYMLDEMLDFFKVYAARNDKARFLIVTLEDPEMIRQTASDRGFDTAMLIIHPASRDDVPRLLAAADVGIFFIKPVFSKAASSPTKLGEMLATGLPIIANAGVGDVEQMVEQTGCGAVIGEFTTAGYEHGLDRLGQLAGSAETRRAQARTLFDVQLGIERYDIIYRKLAS